METWEKDKIEYQIEKLEDYLTTFYGNTSRVTTKKYAIRERIQNLKSKLGE